MPFQLDDAVDAIDLAECEVRAQGALRYGESEKLLGSTPLQQMTDDRGALPVEEAPSLGGGVELEAEQFIERHQFASLLANAEVSFVQLLLVERINRQSQTFIAPEGDVGEVIGKQDVAKFVR